MISVDLDKIITAQALQSHLESILYEVEEQEKMFVITKKGRPRAALINVDYLEELTGRSVKNESVDYDRYEAAKPMAGEPVGPTAGIPESPALDKNIITPQTSTKPTAELNAETIIKEASTESAETEPTENEADFDLPELSIDDLAFEEPEPTTGAAVPQLDQLLEEVPNQQPPTPPTTTG